MSKKKTIHLPVNRVEGDLEIRVELEEGVVSDAWCIGTMFRGYENILVGRGALDGLVITPRVCGICSTCHLTAASSALDMISGVEVPDDALRIRNIALMVEHIQSDLRHGFLIFTPDFCTSLYQDHALYEEARRRYEPFKGQTCIEVVRETKNVLEIIAILGGQWPHSSFMVPGGVVSVPKRSDILLCQYLLAGYRRWYEHKILGCSLERWLEVESACGLDNWLDESDLHRDSDLGFYIRFARQAGLDMIGKGHGNFISYGALDIPGQTGIIGNGGRKTLIPSGFAVGCDVQQFDQSKISEHVASSWFMDYEGGRHPFLGETKPYATGAEGQKYTWTKAPRYNGLPAQTGPLAEMVISGVSLFKDLVGQKGPNVLVRELARLVRPAFLIPTMEIWLKELAADKGDYYRSPGEIKEGEGFGLTEAARGALGHWVKIRDGRIEHYQIITPTAWHASPRDSSGVRGEWEESLIGTRVRNADNPVEIGHVIRSYDPCQVCSVHTVRAGKTGLTISGGFAI
jgi:Ni,Fe-hydrogenase I large subunit